MTDPDPPWNKWEDTSPDWRDSGRRIQIEREGRLITGVLFVDDFNSDGEGSEWPIWGIRDDSGAECSFYDNERWRFLD